MIETTLPVSIGQTLREWLTDKKITQVELARRAGLSTKHTWDLVHDRVRLTEESARKLEQGTGVPSVTWLRVDINYRDAVARRRAKPRQRRETPVSIVDEIEAAS